jgi:hypothetical protein
MGDHSDKESDSDDDDDDDEKEGDNNNDNNNVGFDQLINEDSDDDDDDVLIQTMNTNKTNVGSSLFTTSRHKEQQYEHFQDSDDEKDYPTTKTSSSKY